LECINKTGIILKGNSCECNTYSGFYTNRINGSIDFECKPCHPLAQNCSGPNFWEAFSCNLTISNISPINGTRCLCKEGYYYIEGNVNFPGLAKCGSINLIFNILECSPACLACNNTQDNCTKVPEKIPESQNAVVATVTTR